ncbi:hypothetical protein LSTR_LSTR007770 [Laodelphax striatellus]|uniref:Uncharacterized protein n=1 Tax=Laodelphax striatellus TaxID=195883 RepID=A0A482XR80_LAOST|nr:hypothetical protein LSTR_LSTR007770 [Laodelphax striatellus]
MFSYGDKYSNAYLRLGQSWQDKVGTESDTVICERNTDEGAYLEEYETKLEWLSSTLTSWEDVDDGYQKIDVKEYFVITKREVWNCRGKENTQTSSLNFLRIVTELLARIDSNMPSFYDGFEVFLLPDTSVPQVKSNGRFIPIVREIKYINSKSHEALKYGNGNRFKENRINFERGSVLLKETGTSDPQTPPSVHLEKYLQKNFYEFIETGQSPEKSIGSSDEVAVCKRSDKDPNVYAETYHTKWWRTIMRNAKPTKVDNLVFTINFVITKHELWTCKTKGSNEKFVRSIMEYIGERPFELVYYSNAINIWKFVFNVVKKTESIAVRDIAYYENSNRVNYDGWIVEEEHFVDKIHLQKFLPSSSREKSGLKRNIV